MSVPAATSVGWHVEEEPYVVQLERELTRLGIKEQLKTLFHDHPELAQMKSIKEMDAYLATH